MGHKNSDWMFNLCIVCMFVLFLGLGAFIYYQYQHQSHLVLSKDYLEWSYSTPLTVDKELFLTGNSADVITKTEMIYDEGAIKELGEHEILFRYRTSFDQLEEKTAILNIVDRQAPYFVDNNFELVIMQDAQDVEIERYFIAKDTVSEADVRIVEDSSDKLDYGIPGMYIIRVEAFDEAGNTNYKDVMTRVSDNMQDDFTGYADTGEIPVSELAEDLIVSGELKIESAIGSDGNVVAEGIYSDPVKQEEYLVKKVAEEQALKEAEAEKAKKETTTTTKTK